MRVNARDVVVCYQFFLGCCVLRFPLSRFGKNDVVVGPLAEKKKQLVVVLAGDVSIRSVCYQLM